MALDLYSGNTRECIPDHEEGLLNLVNETEHPQLSRMKENYYKDPVFSAEQCNGLVHEIISLLPIIEKSNDLKYMLPLLNRILVFFSKSYKSNEVVRCESD